MAKILVTGDKGYVGSNLAKFLKLKGFEVRGYDLKDGKDILDFERLNGEMGGCKFVYHCAAISGLKACEQDRERAYYVNVVGTQNVVDCATEHGVKPVLFSSFAVKTTPIPSYYANLKRLCECLSDHAVVLRPSNIFGGENYAQKGLVITRFAKDNPIRVYGGQQLRDFVHISKVLEKCLEAMTLPYGIYDVCSGQQVSVGNLALIFSTVRGVPIEYFEAREWEK